MPCGLQFPRLDRTAGRCGVKAGWIRVEAGARAWAGRETEGRGEESEDVGEEA